VCWCHLSSSVCLSLSVARALSLTFYRSLTLSTSRARTLSLTDSLAHSLSLQTAHGKADSCVSYNQYVVFDSSQLLPRFLVQVSTFLCALERKCLCAPKCVCGRERYGCVTTQRHAYFTTSSPHSVPHSTLCVCRQEFPRAKKPRDLTIVCAAGVWSSPCGVGGFIEGKISDRGGRWTRPRDNSGGGDEIRLSEDGAYTTWHGPRARSSVTAFSRASCSEDKNKSRVCCRRCYWSRHLELAFHSPAL